MSIVVKSVHLTTGLEIHVDLKRHPQVSVTAGGDRWLVWQGHNGELVVANGSTPPSEIQDPPSIVDKCTYGCPRCRPAEYGSK